MSNKEIHQKEPLNNSLPLTTEEAAPFLGIKPSTLEVWRCRGEGPTFLKIGRSVRYRKSDLLDFLEKSVRQSTSQAA